MLQDSCREFLTRVTKPGSKEDQYWSQSAPIIRVTPGAPHSAGDLDGPDVVPDGHQPTYGTRHGAGGLDGSAASGTQHAGGDLDGPDVVPDGHQPTYGTRHGAGDLDGSAASAEATRAARHAGGDLDGLPDFDIETSNPAMPTASMRLPGKLSC